MSRRYLSGWLLLVSILCCSGWAADAKKTCIGRVVDESSQPVAGATVTLYLWSVNSSSGEPEQVSTQEQTTGEDGSFTVSAEPVDSQSGRRTQALIVARKEGLAMAWENWSKRDNMATALKLTKPATISGRIVDDADKPVPGASVAMAYVAIASAGRQSRISDARAIPAFTTKADADGSFTFSGLPTDASMDFWAAAPGRATVCTRNPRGGWGGFTAGQTDVKIVLPLEAHVEGKVLEKTTGKGIGGLTVRCYDPDGGVMVWARPVVSAEDGSFSFAGLPGMQCSIGLVQPSKETSQWVAEPVSVTVEPGKTAGGVVLSVSRGGVVEVKVVDRDKKPLAGANITATSAEGGLSHTGTSDDNGVATIRLNPGNYAVKVYKEGLMQPREDTTCLVEDGKTATVEVVLKSSPSVSGVVRDAAGKLVQDAHIEVFPFGSGRGVKSDAEGRFTVKWNPQQWGSSQQIQCVLVARHPQLNLVAVCELDEDASAVNVTMSPGVTLTGKVAGSESLPLAGAKVTVMLSTSNYSNPLDSTLEITTDSHGRYEFKAAPQDSKLYVEASANGYGQTGTQVQTGDSGSTEVDALVLRLANESISGIVVDANDSPVSGAEVNLYGDGQQYQNIRTDSKGRFRMTKLCDGQVQLNAWVGGETAMNGNAGAMAGDTDVKIVVSPQGSGRTGSRSSGQSASRIGKPLADMASLNIKADPNSIKGKPMLLCFVDRSQRPSRHCIEEVVARQTELAGKGLSIACIQVGETAAKAESTVPFGQISDDEKASAKWGIQRLPWLILVDGKGTIKAEGFTVAEIDDKLAGATGTK
jgi:uncharacterized GH25 family protein